MGIITVLLYSTGYLSGEFHVPHWVAISCYIAIGLGTLIGRLEDHRDDGQPHHQAVPAPGLQRLDRRLDHAVHRLAARASRSRPPTPSPAAIIGAGVARRASAVRWGVAQNVVTAWVITIPASATVAALFYWLTTFF